MKISELYESLSGKILYHGGPEKISRFTIPPHGIFLTPHLDWAKQYGTEITRAKIYADKIYLVDYKNEIDGDIIDALFDRDYDTLTKLITQLKKQGYQAIQTITDSEMVVVFPGTSIRIIDTIKDLPKQGVQLKITMDGAEVDVRVLDNSNQVGYVIFDRDGDTLISNDLAIDDEYQRRGIATEIYNDLRDSGFTIKRSSDQTSFGKAFWDKSKGERSEIWEINK